ncbi:MAG: hypothetical protein GC190_16075 [Alphaproteobacteria bacterium]|nr:hypothetical protein [Alphaproteobacteria bacterium]
MYFDYRRCITRYKRGEESKDDLARKLMPAVHSQGGKLYGAFGAQLGLQSNEIVVVTRWPDGVPAARLDTIFSDSLAITTMTARSLAPTVRPTTPSLQKRTGIFVHRWFTFAERDWPEFLRLSGEAWPDFEATYDAQIQAFLKASPETDSTGAVLLLTQYRDHGEWERSRTPTGRAEASWTNFRRRHELTLSTIAVSTTLLAAAG